MPASISGAAFQLIRKLVKQTSDMDERMGLATVGHGARSRPFSWSVFLPLSPFTRSHFISVTYYNGSQCDLRENLAQSALHGKTMQKKGGLFSLNSTV